MKKTIAKLMAAAMLLSAVPAVTMPSFVSQASDKAVSATSITYAGTSLSTNAANVKDVDNGMTSKGVFAKVAFPDFVTVDGNNTAAVGKLSDVISISVNKVTNQSGPKVTLADGKTYNTAVWEFKASKKANISSQAMSTLRSSILDGTNTFQLKTRVSYEDTNADGTKRAWATVQNTDLYSTTNYRFGGKIETGQKILVGVYDEDALFNDGDVYAKIGNVSTTNKDERLIEVELLQGAKGQLKGNDALRGNTLNLNTVWIGGNQFKVTKLGSQALKEAHMKKLIAKNITQVGKGALRKCKNVRKVNISDKNKVRKIRSKAFYDCKNLKHINIDGRKLKEVGKDAFGKLKKNCVIKFKASKSKYNECVKKAKKSGAKNVKYARIAP